MSVLRILCCLCLVLCLSMSASAQWQTASGNTTTTDKVGIGTTVPGSILELRAPAPLQTIRYTDPANYGALYFYENSDYVGTLQFLGSNYVAPAYRNQLMLINFRPGPEVFYTSSLERMRIDASGNMGIGTSAPAAKLQVEDLDNNTEMLVSAGDNPGVAHSPSLSLMRKDGNDVQVAKYGLKLDAADGNKFKLLYGGAGAFTATPLVVDTSGNVGIGLTNPSSLLSVAGTIQTSIGVLFPDGNTQKVAYPFDINNNTSDLNRSSAGPVTSSVTNTSASGSAALAAIAGGGVAYVRLASNETPAARDWRVGMIDNSGVFRIRNNVSGTDLMTINGSAIHFNGNVDGTTIQATYQDLAEWVPAAKTMPAGTVVIVGEDGDNTVAPSVHAYDTSVAGVVSATPGLLLGVASASKAKIATTGRVRVRVDATKSPIRKGDLLVTSDRPGMAMKSEPINVGGVKLHRPGTLIGKALEPLASGEGEILVLLSLQ
jgi:hypothetical protein